MRMLRAPRGGSGANSANPCRRCGLSASPSPLPARSLIAAPGSSSSGSSGTRFASSSSKFGTGSGSSSSSSSGARAARELPQLPDRRPLYIATGIVVLGAWTLFTNYATNKEKLSSSVFRSVLIQLKDSDRIAEAIGSPVMLEPGAFGDPWIKGSVSLSLDEFTRPTPPD